MISASSRSLRRDHDVIGEDYLGGCSYHSLADFTAPGGYFRDMIHEACRDARQTVGEFRNCPLRRID